MQNEDDAGTINRSCTNNLKANVSLGNTNLGTEITKTKEILLQPIGVMHDWITMKMASSTAKCIHPVHVSHHQYVEIMLLNHIRFGVELLSARRNITMNTISIA